MRRILVTLCSILIAASFAPTAWSQSAAAVADRAKADEHYYRGDYAAASAGYEKLLKDYPSDVIAPAIQLQLAYCLFYLGRYDDALGLLSKAGSAPAASAELKQAVEGLAPQVLSAKARSLPAGDAARSAALAEAIAKFTAYIDAYPQARDLETAIYNRAVARHQTGDYEGAARDLQLNLQKFSQSRTIGGSKYLLALTWASQASAQAARDDPPAREQAAGLYQKSADLLREIIREKNDVGLVNDANYQLGDILLVLASLRPEAERPALYAAAVSAFRALAPKERLIAMQEERLREFPAKKAAALRANDAALKKALDQENERELVKLAELRGKPDQAGAALARIGEAWFLQGKYNETRVVLSHLFPLLQSEAEQKRVLYFLAMSYAVQNVREQATARYNEFAARFKGDPIAENLPIAMGEMWLRLDNPAEAARYFDEARAIYPNGRLTGFAVVQRAAALARLNNLPEALRAYQGYLSTNPPPAMAALALAGIADIHRDTAKWDDALAAYRQLKEKYPDSPKAVEADHWIAICTQQKGDLSGALPMFEAFAKNRPNHPLAPSSLYAMGAAQVAIGQRKEGAATIASVAEKYPDSKPAPFTYFTLAQLAASEGNSAEVIRLMQEFVAKHPNDDKVFYAYETWAQAAENSKQPDEAIKAFRAYLDKYAESPQAGDAMVKIADLQRRRAEALGRYPGLNEAEKTQWTAFVNESVSVIEAMIEKYPRSKSLAQGLQSLLAAQRLLVAAGLKTPLDVDAYFEQLAQNASSPDAKSRAMFTLASYVREQDKTRALKIMTEAYKPAFVYSPEDMGSYGLALLEQNQLTEAAAVFEKLAADYPVPAGATPSRLIQEAQSIALFGRARVAQARGRSDEAGKLFAQLKAQYPWSPRVLEADYGIAEALKQSGKVDEALALLAAVSRAPSASAELRANSMLLGGGLMLEKMKTAGDDKQREKYLAAAIDSYLKIAQFYGGVPSAAAAGLWEGGQLLEKQAAAAKDPKFKETQASKARAAYKQLVSDYANTEYAGKAQERLRSLGGT